MKVLPNRLLTLLSLFCLTGFTALPVARAANPGRDLGLSLLQAQVTSKTSLRRLNCEQLEKAVESATRNHRPEVVHIFIAALSLNEWDLKRKEEIPLSCECVVRLFHAAAQVVPERAPILLQVAESLYPECAGALTDALRALDGRAGSGGNGFDPNDPSGGDATGPGGTGTGPGFPGSPGFGGSVPSGGVALPTPIPAQVTSVVNG